MRLFRRRSRHTGKDLPTWHVGFYLPGNPKEITRSTGTTDRTDAKRLGKEWEAHALRLGPRAPTAMTLRVADCLALVVADYHDKAQALPPGHIPALWSALGHLLLTEVTTDMLRQLRRRWQREGVTWRAGTLDVPELGRLTWEARGLLARPAASDPPVRAASDETCNRYLQTLRRGFNLARRDYGLVTGVVFPMVAGNYRGKNIPAEDFYRLLAGIPPDVRRDVVELAYLTGVRLGQLRATEKRNVRLEHDRAAALVWEPQQTKHGKRTKKPHVLPLVGRAQAIVQAAWERRLLDVPALFHLDGQPLGRLRSEWTRACRTAGLPAGRKRGGFTLHNTRHSALSNLVNAGVSTTVAMSISGHATENVFRRYAITAEATQRDALAAAEALVQAQRATGPGTIQPLSAPDHRHPSPAPLDALGKYAT